MHSSTNWIWIPQDDGARNLTICARRAFSLSDKPTEAFLEISAENRYVLYINDERVGQGPARSWSHNKQYDRYEVSRYLRDDTNIIAVQTVRWGVGTGYSIAAPGGLIAQLTLGYSPDPVLITDSTWKTATHPAYNPRVPRQALGEAFTEQYDACFEMDNWTALDFNDSSWLPAKVLGPVGTEPWVDMQPRSIPYLTEQPVYPVRVFDACAVEPPKHSYALDLYDLFQQPEGTKPFKILVAEIVSDRAADVTLVRMNATYNLDVFGEMRINGSNVTFEADRTTFPVNEGANLLTMRFQNEVQSLPSWVFNTEADIEMRTPVGDPKGPVALYLGDSYDDPIIAGIWNAHSVQDISDWLPELHPLKPEERYTDIFALSNMRRALPDINVRIDSPQALCSANSEYTVAYPPKNGDLEFLLDFGEEIVGLIEFEVDAAIGTVIDFNCFEAIVNSEWSWTDNLNNTLRYTAKEGWQRFHSTVRRGFRYMQVTIRDASRPVRIREILCLKNTYPVLQEGAFTCSDALLTRIWEMGRRTTQLCMEDTFVDCPAYEQTFWVGDARNEALTAYSAFGDTQITERCLRFVPESLFRSPMPECATPAGHGGILPDWSMFWVLSCEEYYRYTGNIQFAKDIFPSVLQTCEFILSQRNEKGLWQYAAWNMLDWARMDCPPDGIIAHENILIVETLRRAAALSDAAGKTDGARLRKEADALKAAINEHLWAEEHHAYVDSIHADGVPSTVFSQQTQTMAYLCGCVPSERLPWIESYIKQVPEEWVKIGSPWMMWFSFESMARTSDFQTIVDWTRKYWGDMLEYDATTCWETFPSWAAGRWSPSRSWCHAWSAAPTYFLSTYQLGVDLLESNAKKITIAPKPCGLTWAKGRVPTHQGTITISWRIDDGKFNLSAILPIGVEANVQPPDGYEIGEINIRHSSVSTSPTGVVTKESIYRVEHLPFS